MNALELFSGTMSFGKVMKPKGYNVISVDINNYGGRYTPTHQTDILSFDYKQYPKDYFKIIWASPPCIYYSKLQNMWIGKHKKDENGNLYLFTREILEEKRKLGDQWVKKALEIINYFDCEYWFLENPQTGTLKSRPFMKDINYYDVDYCKYCDWGYRKRTRIWTNKKDFTPRVCNKDCGSIPHISVKYIKEDGVSSQELRYRIPPTLIEDLVKV